ncbi:uncharacterized protein IL334_000807 [Kwoniella shivajii]|uniref:Hydrolase n=1 Tax=Kwoniella shivajii TaxID=564305 RepID=A0ABZ1CQ79_9TREE|nr:hypothetical protein IL334_000807 [Kwoniella shivajii]
MPRIELAPSPSIPLHSLEALQSDALLPICKACGTQYSASSPIIEKNCLICEDPRQYVPSTGQEWSSLAELAESDIQKQNDKESEKRKNYLIEDDEDGRIKMIACDPSFGINQTPILIETSEGSYIWDCASFISLPLVGHLTTLSKPLRAIAISHPHFFTTSLTWSRALKVPLYLCEDDREWFQRSGDITHDDQVIWWKGEQELGKGVKVIQCGGHFPGSSILYWDRLGEPAPPKDDLPTKPTPVSGIIFTADTLMVQPTQRSFSFLWSVPNLIPLRPQAILSIQERLKYLSFTQATSSWPNRWIREDAKKVLDESVTAYLAAEGWRVDEGRLVELLT